MVSGFVMYLPTAVRGGDFGRVSSFAIGRVARIIPAYWLALVVALILLAALSELPPAWSVLAHFTMFQTPALLVDGPVVVNGAQVGSFALGFGVVPPVWTMSVETAFYLVLPLVAVPLLPPSPCRAGRSGRASSPCGRCGAARRRCRLVLRHRPQRGHRGTLRRLLREPVPELGVRAGLRDDDRLALRAAARPDPARLLEQRALWAVLASAPAVAVVVYLTGLDAVNDPNALNGLFARQPLLLSFAYPLATASAMLAFSLAPPGCRGPLPTSRCAGSPISATAST